MIKNPVTVIKQAEGIIDPYEKMTNLYQGFYQSTLDKDNYVFYIPNAQNCGDMFKKAVFTKPNTVITINFGTGRKINNVSSMFNSVTVSGEGSVETLNILGDTSSIIVFTNFYFAGSNLAKPKHIIGDLDVSGANSASSLVGFANNRLETITFVKDSIHYSITIPSSALSTLSLVSIANGLNANYTGTLALSNTAINNLSGIMGTVNDGVFVQNDSGLIALNTFITQTKGWTIGTAS